MDNPEPTIHMLLAEACERSLTEERRYMVSDRRRNCLAIVVSGLTNDEFDSIKAQFDVLIKTLPSILR